MVIKGFISFQNAWVKSSEDKCITFPLLTSDLVAGVTCPNVNGRAKTAGWKQLLKLHRPEQKASKKRIIKATVLAWQLKVYNFSLSDTLAIESY